MPAHFISYEYSFPGRSTIHIQGLGVVPATGSFSYITTEPQLVFEDAETHAEIANSPLRETVIAAAKPPLDQMPKEEEFSQSLREFAWTSKHSVLVQVTSVISRHFRYQSRESQGITYLRTTFAPVPLPGTSEGVLCRVALLVTIPSGGASAVRLDVHSMVQEGRSHSDEFRPATDPAMEAAANAYVDRLVAEIRTGG
jgi:hypothetical protein